MRILVDYSPTRWRQFPSKMTRIEIRHFCFIHYILLRTQFNTENQKLAIKRLPVYQVQLNLSFFFVLQKVSEKVGGAEGTKLDEDFKEMERVSQKMCIMSLQLQSWEILIKKSKYIIYYTWNKILIVMKGHMMQR